jgi:ELWxxDGT repeat protein
MGSWTPRFLSPSVLAVLLSALPAFGAGGPAHLVADLDPGTSAFDPAALPRFSSYTAVNGRVVAPVFGLFVSDGTAAGTHLLHDFALPAGGTEPFGVISPQLTAAGGHLFFRADDGLHGLELWTTDGTPEGTALVKDVNPGPDGSLPGSLTTAPTGELFFAAADGAHGRELWALPSPQFPPPPH